MPGVQSFLDRPRSGYIVDQIGTLDMSDPTLKITEQWRQENGYLNRGGVIIVQGNYVQAWVRELPPANHWQPGCVAVNESGWAWIATGGDAVEGAEHWEGSHIHAQKSS